MTTFFYCCSKGFDIFKTYREKSSKMQYISILRKAIIPVAISKLSGHSSCFITAWIVRACSKHISLKLNEVSGINLISKFPRNEKQHDLVRWLIVYVLVIHIRQYLTHNKTSSLTIIIQHLRIWSVRPESYVHHEKAQIIVSHMLLRVQGPRLLYNDKWRISIINRPLRKANRVFWRSILNRKPW